MKISFVQDGGGLLDHAGDDESHPFLAFFQEALAQLQEEVESWASALYFPN